MIKWIRSMVGRPRGRRVSGKYEAASPVHAGLWPGRDALSADAAFNPAVRKILRERARTQVENDPIAEGLVDTLASDLVGTGPRLQVLTPGDDEGPRDQIENAFHAWANAVDLSEKMRVMRRARAVDGEGFIVLVNNPMLQDPVKLDLKLVEADQVTSRLGVMVSPTDIDGVKIDEYGNPISYTILRNHPGSVIGIGAAFQFDEIPARSVIHYFRVQRSGQHRGVPDIAPALMRFAYMQRFTLATIVAAEQAANHAGILKSDSPPEGADPVAPMESIEIDRGTLTTMPQGWSLDQIRAEHPNTEFSVFRREIIGDIARCLQMPLNVALLNSSGFNFASGRLDWLVYGNVIRVDRGRVERTILDRILAAWLDEAVLVTGLFPPAVRALVKPGGSLPHQWAWPGSDHPIDPQTEALAATERLNNRTSNLAIEYAQKGRDWQEELRQIKKERAQMEADGTLPEEAAAALQRADVNQKKKGQANANAQ